MAPSYRCSLAPFSVRSGAAPVHLFHVPLSVPGARLFGFLIGEDPTESVRILRTIEELAQKFAPEPEQTLETLASAFFRLANRAVRELSLVSFSLKRPPVSGALAAITYGQQIALAGRQALAFRTSGGGSAPPSDLLTPESKSDYKTLFPSLVIGGLGKRDMLLLANRALLDFCAPAHVGKLMNAGSPEATRELILSLLHDLQPTSPIAGVVIKIAPHDQLLALQATPTDSLNSLLKHARDTEALLTPAFLPAVHRLFFWRRAPRPHRAIPPPKLSSKNNTLFQTIKKFPATIRLFASTARDIPSRLRSLVGSFRARSKRDQTRILLFIAMALGILFGVAGVWRGSVRAHETKLVSSARDALMAKRAAMEASVLYGDEVSAWNSLDEAARAIAALPESSRRLRQEKNTLRSELEADARRLRHEAIIENPERAADFTIPASDAHPPTAALYNNRLYRLNADARMITKHRPLAQAPDGWDAGTPWLPAPVDELADASAIAVQSAIFIGTDSGAIYKYLKGNRVDWMPGRIDPPLAAITRLRAPEESDYLYILSSDTKRVIVLDRARGSVLAQYTSPAFTAPLDLFIDEFKRVLYVKNGDGIYALPAAHLK